MTDFDQSWFDRVKFDMREAGSGKVGVHVWKVGHICKFFTLPVGKFVSANLWEQLHELAIKAWAQENDIIIQDVCPTCGHLIKDCQRMYEGNRFCVNCGHMLEGENHV